MYRTENGTILGEELASPKMPSSTLAGADAMAESIRWVM